MPRTSRLEACSSCYHITARGCGRRRIFEDSADRVSLLQLLRKHARERSVAVKAWCLMENHFHLLAMGDLANIRKMMHGLASSYAIRFNTKHGHVGHVFQERFHSVPVETDEQLLATIRYIHRNPTEGNVAPFETYRWSSYRQYMGMKGICEIQDIISMFGDRQTIRRFHEVEDDARGLVGIKGPRHRLPDAEAAKIATSCFGDRFADEIPALPRNRRDEALKALFDKGVSIRQIERLTGIGRGIVQKACKR